MALQNEILSHCTVILEGSDHSYEGDTGEDGILSFDDIQPDVYTLTVKKEGYEVYVEEGITIDEENKAIRAKIAMKELPHEIAYMVLVTDDSTDKVNVDEATVVMYNTKGHIVYHGKTDKEGQVTFPKVHYGKYLVKITKEGYQRFTKNITVNATNNNPRTENVELIKINKE